MDPNDQQVTAPEAEVTTAPSPSETDGVSSSDTVNDAPESFADAIVRDFQETFGDDEPADTGEKTGEDDGKSDDKPDPDPADAAADTQKPEKEEPSVDADDTEDDQFRIPDEQFKALPEGVKQRLGHLNARAKRAERELSERDEQIAPLQESHERFTTLQTYVTENNIEPENVTLAFGAMAKLSKGDYQGFLDAVGPWYTHAQQLVGAVISPELQTRVDDGLLTEEDAREMTKARANSATLQSQNETLVQDRQQRTETDAQAQESERIVSAVNTREAALRSSDPDYAQKAPAIKAMLDTIMKRSGPPKTSQEAVELVNEAHATVTSTFVKATPPKPTPPRPGASQTPRGNAPPENMQDAVFDGLRDLPVS